jgi:hypothetical protein
MSSQDKQQAAFACEGPANRRHLAFAAKAAADGKRMNSLHRAGWLACLSLFSTCMLEAAAAAPPAKVRLFILSGQSNMAGLNPDISFTPALKKAFPNDEVIVVKHAQGGQPIRRWYKAWTAPKDAKLPPSKTKQEPGDLYDALMARVNRAMQGKTADTVAFVWMQGERDAREGLSAVYADALRGLIRQVRDDLKRPDIAVVIGRLSDFKKGDQHWDAVRAAQEKVVDTDPRAACVDTDDLNGPKNDLHYTKEGYEQLGRRFATKAADLVANTEQPR